MEKTTAKSDNPTRKNFAVDPSNCKTFQDRVHWLIGDESVSAFARRAGLIQTTFNQTVSGKTLPNKKTLESIASASGVSLHWLITGKGPVMEADLISHSNQLDENVKKNNNDNESKSEDDRISNLKKQQDYLVSLNNAAISINDTDNIPFDDLKDHFIDVINVLLKYKKEKNIELLIEESKAFTDRLIKEYKKIKEG